MTENKPGPWTVKGVDQADRDMINEAARRLLETTGQFLVEAARLRIANGRVSVIPSGPSQEDPGHPPARVAAPPGILDLVTVLRELQDVPRCQRVSSRARKLLAHQLDQHLPPGPPRDPPRRAPIPLEPVAAADAPPQAVRGASARPALPGPQAGARARPPAR